MPDRLPDVWPIEYLRKCVDAWGKVDGVPLAQVYVLLQAQERPRSRPQEGVLEPNPDDLGQWDTERLEAAGMEKARRSRPSKTPEKESTEPAPPPPPPPPVPLADALKAAPFLVLVGEPGSGKSTTLQYVGLRFAHATLNQTDPFNLPESRIPIRLALPEVGRYLASSQGQGIPPLERALLDALRALHDDPALEMGCLQQWRDKGQLLVLLDGLDEVPEGQRMSVREEVVRFRLRAPGCRILVATRPAGYVPLSEPFQDYRLRPLDEEQAQSFLAGWLSAWVAGNGGEATERARALWKQIQANPSLRRLALTPLILKMLAEIGAEDSQALVQMWNRADLYQRYVAGAAWERARRRGAQKQEKAWALAMLEAWAWYRHVLGRRTEDELRTTLKEAPWTPPGKDGLEPLLAPGDEARWVRARRLLREEYSLLALVGSDWVFIHQTWQEYFVARRLARAWQQDEGMTWRFLKPRLHLSPWEEPLHLLVALLPSQQAKAFVEKVRRARSPYERQWRRDARLSLSLAAAANLSEWPLRALERYFNLRVRRAAVGALDHLGPDTGVVTALVQTLNTGRERWAMAEAVSLKFPKTLQDSILAKGLRLVIGGSSWRNRWAAAEGLGALGPKAAKHPGVIKGLVQASRDGDEGVRWAAVRALGAMGSEGAQYPAVSRTLIQALGDPDPEVCIAAAQALGSLGPKIGHAEVIEELLQQGVKNSDWRVSQAVIETLGFLGPEVVKHSGAMDILFQALGHRNGFFRQAAIQAIKTLRLEVTSENVKKWVQALRDDDPLVRRPAARALGTLGSEAARYPGVVQGLLQALKDSDSLVRGEAAEAIGALGSEVAAYPGVVQGLIQTLKDEDPFVRMSGASTLGIFGLATLQHPGVVAELLQALEDRHSLVRWASARALGTLGSKTNQYAEVVERLLQTLQDKDNFVRWGAAQALSILGPKIAGCSGVMDGFMRALGDRDMLVRRFAMEALMTIIDDEAIHRMIPQLRRRIHWIWPWRRQQAYELLEHLWPAWEAEQARKQAERTGLVDPLFPPPPSPPPRWWQAIRWVAVALTALALLVAAIGVGLLVDPFGDPFFELLSAHFSWLQSSPSFGTRWSIAIALMLLSAGLGTLARSLWRRR